MVKWGRAWRAAGAWLGWSIVWGIVGIIFIVVGFVIIGESAVNLSGNFNYFAGGAAGGTILIIIGGLIWGLGSVAAFFKINAEVVADEMKNQNRMQTYTPAPQNVVAAPVAQTAPVCPTCGSPLRFIPQYQRWYCDKEGKYV